MFCLLTFSRVSLFPLFPHAIAMVVHVTSLCCRFSGEIIPLQVDSSAGSQAEAGILGLGWPALLSATKWLCNQFLLKSFQDQG